jgi:hypothetical protein
MAKRKPGLHRKVSSIFDGVKVPPTPNDPAAQNENSSPKPQLPPKHPLLESKKKSIDLKKAVPLSQQPQPPAMDKPPLPPMPMPKMPKPSARPMPKHGKYQLSAPIPGISDRKRKVQLAIIPALFSILILLLISVFGTDTPADTTTENAAENIEELIANMPSKTPEIDWEIPVVYSATLADPMLQNTERIIAQKIAIEGPNEVEPELTEEEIVIEEQKSPKDSIIIQSILYGKQKSSVVINNNILYVGDEVEGATITSINKDSVDFQFNDKEFTVQWRLLK